MMTSRVLRIFTRRCFWLVVRRYNYKS